MREIKYQAWNWKEIIIHSSLVNCLTRHHTPILPILLWWEKHITIIDGIPKEEWKLREYTWLKDKNGKEIYEGDIIKWRVTDKRCIDWHMIVEKERISNDFTDVYWYDTLCELWEVIGNIYETPNFLNKNK